MNRKKIKIVLTDQIYNVLAGFLYAAGICYFAKNADFAPGGISGLALIFNHLWNLPIGITSLILNLPLIGLSYRFLGAGFLKRTVISMLYCTFFQDVVFARIPGYQGEPVLAALFAGVLWGAGLALMYMRGSSSGGTDFLTMTIKTLHPQLSVGAVTGSIDVVVILLGWLVFGAVDAVLYGLITTFVTSTVIDKLLYGSSASKLVTIITTHGQEIADSIAVLFERGSTMFDAVGTYTGTERKILLCACSRQEAYKVRETAYALDQKCLVLISDTSEVYGEGFLSHKPQSE